MADHVVAVVDDNVAILRSMKFLLELAGYEVITHTSAASFQAVPMTDLACLIVDQNLPGMTGLQLVAQLRQEENHTPVLLVCGLSSPDIIARAAALGIEQVVEKPAEPAAILKIIGEIIAKH